MGKKYGANPTVLFAIHNDANQNYENLSMNDAIPNNLETTSTVSLRVSGNNLVLHSGFLHFAGSIDETGIPLGEEGLDGYDSILITMLYDLYKSTLKMYVQADDRIYIREIKLNSPSSYHLSHYGLFSSMLNISTVTSTPIDLTL